MAVRFRDTRFVLLPEEVRLANGVVFRGRAEKADRREAFTLRMVKELDGYKCDWLHRSERFGMEIKPPADAELTAAQDTVRNFLDILLGGDLRQAHALMAPEWKRKLAPPYPSDEKAGLTYNPGFLTGATKAWKWRLHRVHAAEGGTRPGQDDRNVYGRVSGRRADGPVHRDGGQGPGDRPVADPGLRARQVVSGPNPPTPTCHEHPR